MAIRKSRPAKTLILDQRPLTTADVVQVGLRRVQVELPTSKSQRTELQRPLDASCRRIQEAVASNRTVYGVNTGFGGMSGVQIDRDDARELQHNLLRFLKAGAGRPLPAVDVRGAMLLRAKSFLRGASGARWELVERLVQFLKHDVTPVVREFGSIGASGDLVPLANIAAALIGLDEGCLVDYQGQTQEAIAVLRELRLERLTLEPKEGLALVNGTSMSTAIAARCVYETKLLVSVTLGAHALMIQALNGMVESFADFIHRLKPHPGQCWTAQRMRELLHDSKLIGETRSGTHQRVSLEERVLKLVPHNRVAMNGLGELVQQLHNRGAGERVQEQDVEQLGRIVTAILSDVSRGVYDVEPIQDRYSIRCLPQFLGPAVEGLQTIERQIEIEMNSANDNPLVDGESSEIYHGGNFLAQYPAVGMDQLRYFLGLIAKHLDAQIALLVTPEFSFGLPPSLVGNPARRVNMGLKGLQIAGNSIMPLLTYLSNPIATHFATHAEQYNQNVNSQGFASANLARQAVDAFRQYLAIALIFGVQAIDLRLQLQTPAGELEPQDFLSPSTLALYHAVRHCVGRPADGQVFVRDDHCQSFERWIEAIALDLAELRDGRIATAAAPSCDAWQELS